MKPTYDTDDIGNRLRRHIINTSKQNAPPAVQVSIYDGSRQFTDGYVWGTVGDKRVQVIATGSVNLTLATVTTPVVVWALPPNPGEASGAYIMINVAIDGNTNNRAPGLVAAGVMIVGSAGSGGTTKTTPGTVDAWIEVVINGSTYYIPAYTSKTS